jgi:hypothetical protein
MNMMKEIGNIEAGGGSDDIGGSGGREGAMDGMQAMM